MIMTESAPNAEDVLDNLNGLLPKIDARDRGIAIRLYKRLAEGEPVTAEEIGADLELSKDHVERILDRWYGVVRDDERRVTGFWGLSLRETKHRFKVDGQLLYTWCAWDALFIPELLGRCALVTSHCPVTGQNIRLTVTPWGIEQVEPSSVTMSLLIPEHDKVRENVVQHFCHFVNFFDSPESGSSWTAENPGTFLVSLNDAYILGKRKNADRFGSALTPPAAGRGGNA